MNLAPFELDDEHLAQEIAACEEMASEYGRTGMRARRAVAWLRELKHRRAADTASNERVREVVRRELNEHCMWADAINGEDTLSIANRVAEQLTAPVQLSEDELGVLRFLSKNAARYLSRVPEGSLADATRDRFKAAIVLVDRLLGAAR